LKLFAKNDTMQVHPSDVFITWQTSLTQQGCFFIFFKIYFLLDF